MNGDLPDINVTELLMKISNNVAVIMGDLDNMKNNIKRNNEDFEGKINRVKVEIDCLDKSMQEKLNKNTKDISDLKYSEDKKDASKYRKIIAYLSFAILGICIAKLPDFIVFLIASVH